MAKTEIHLNPPDRLAPVGCPLMVEVEGKLVRAIRTGYIESRDRLMEYLTCSGEKILGRFRWTYP